MILKFYNFFSTQALKVQPHCLVKRTNANLSQLQLWLNDVNRHPGICKGQRSSEKEQHKSEQQHLHRLHRETSLPTVLGACSWNSEWVRYFLLSQSEKTMPPFCLKGQKWGHTLFPYTTFPSYIWTVCIMVGYVTKSLQQDHLRSTTFL